MTTTEQAQLIDDMIKECPDYTVRNFIDVRNEIQDIEDSFPKVRMNSTELIIAITKLIKRA